ncbi:semaphorin-3D-like [Heptranchias perlo]|uniref:semaphorin-3D-like n=1 Tax=Heptranchias perlo TaxID=212740 RepID=UPI00355ABDC1
MSLVAPWNDPEVKKLRAVVTLITTELLHSNSSMVLLDAALSSHYHSLLVDQERGWLLVGAKDHVFMLHLDNISQNTQKIHWPAPKEHVDRCIWAGKSPETECANFIRLLQPFNQTHVYTCGTAAFQPLCAYIELVTETEEPTFRLMPHSVESGLGKCPYNPQEPFAAVLTDGELYAGTSLDFMGGNHAVIRTVGHSSKQQYLKTEQDQQHWLNYPQFVGAYSISDTYNSDDDKVYFFLKEVALEAGNSNKAVYSRVARVCKNDIGGKRSLINRWTTFLKARLLCSVSGHSADRDTYFDELEDTFILQTRDEQNPLIYAVLSTSSSIFRGSAVCVYSMKTIRTVFNGPFAHKEGPAYHWVEYKGRIPYPRPGTCPSETYDPQYKSTKDYPDEVISFMWTHQLMWESVQPIKQRPIFTKINAQYNIRHIVVDRVVAEDDHYEVLFLGTDEGKVLKVITIGKENWETEELILEELSATQNLSPILSMKLSPKQQSLYVSSADSLLQVVVHRCDLYGMLCAECCLSRDPYCAWDGNSCSRYFPTSKRRARRQDVRHGDPVTQCWDLGYGLENAEEKLLYGVEMNSTFLECVPKSPQATVKWFVQQTKAEPIEELKLGEHFVAVEQGLLIHDVHKQDGGAYYCRALEHSFSYTIAHYKLQVIDRRQLEGFPVKEEVDGGLRREHGAIVRELKQRHKENIQTVSRPSLSLSLSADEYCESFWSREKGRNLRRKNAMDGARGRIRRHPEAED